MEIEDRFLAVAVVFSVVCLGALIIAYSFREKDSDYELVTVSAGEECTVSNGCDHPIVLGPMSTPKEGAEISCHAWPTLTEGVTVLPGQIVKCSVWRLGE